VEEIDVIGKSPDKESSIGVWGHRDIGDPGDKVFMHFGFVNRETPMRRKV
jgi:hypothetical protein